MLAIILAFIGQALYLLLPLFFPLTPFLEDKISDAFLILAFYMFYLHFEALSNIKPALTRHSLMVMILTAYYLVFIFDLVGYLPKTIATDFGFILFSIFTVATFSFGSLSFWKIYKLLRDRASFLDLVGICLVLAGQSMILTIDLLVGFHLLSRNGEVRSSINLIALILLIIGMGIFFGNFLKNGVYVYRLSVLVHNIMLYNSGGILVYSQELTQPVEFQKKAFVTSFFMAINAFMKQVIDKKTSLHQIDVKRYQIHFAYLPNEQGCLIVISSGLSYFLRNSLYKFTRTIPNELIKSINDIKTNKKQLRIQLDAYILKTFPYISFNEFNNHN